MLQSFGAYWVGVPNNSYVRCSTFKQAALVRVTSWTCFFFFYKWKIYWSVDWKETSMELSVEGDVEWNNPGTIAPPPPILEKWIEHLTFSDKGHKLGGPVCTLKKVSSCENRSVGRIAHCPGKIVIRKATRTRIHRLRRMLMHTIKSSHVLQTSSTDAKFLPTEEGFIVVWGRRL